VSSLSTLDFLSHLRALDISLRSRDGQLHVDAPTNSITPELRAQIAERKPELLALLNGMGGITRPDLWEIKPEPRGAELPLSFAQLRLWFLDQLEPQGAAYTISMAARIKGQLEVPVVERAISEIVRRHETLRAVFPAANGWPHLKIVPPTAVNMEIVDLTQNSGTEGELLAHQRIATEARKPFDLAKGPLFRAQLLRLGTDDHVLVITVHHTVFDGWSMSVFWREFGALYEAYRSGRPSPLPELPIQYADFAVWQKRFLEGPVRDFHMAYWRQQLEGNLPILELPTDHPRKDQHAPRGARERIHLDPNLSKSLKALGQQEGSSLFMILLATFQILLYRITGQNDILVGTPIAGRNRADLEDLIGFFVNTIVMRGQLSCDLTFVEFLSRVRNAVLDAQVHQDLPFEELVGALDAKPDLNRSPLFQVFYNHLNLHTTFSLIQSLQIEPFGEFEVESKFDLTLYSHERGDSIDLLLLYDANLFDSRRMTILLDQYADLLKQIAENPDRRLDSYSLVSSTGAEVLPDPTAPLENSWAGSVTTRFLENAARNRKQIAVEDSNATWTYGDLERSSAGLASRLRNLGVERGDTVAVFAHRSAPLVLALLGILRAGAAFCILNPDYPPARLVNCIRRVKPKAWIQLTAAGEPPSQVRDALQEFGKERCISLPQANKVLSMSELSGGLESEIELAPDSPAYLTFTSGTTAEPKCIIGTHRPVSHFLEWHSREFWLKETDRFSMLSGLAHDPLLRDIFTPLWVGGTLCVPPTDDILSPGRLALWMSYQKVTVAHLTPALGALLATPDERIAQHASPVPTLRYAFFGGDVLLPRDVDMIHEVSPRAQCVNFYGTTETPQAMGWYRIESADETSDRGTRAIPLGSAIPDAQLVILNRTRGLAGPGELGEIHVRTPYLSVGYRDDERLTQERFIVNPFTNTAGDRLYRTGDLGRYRPDGIVEFVGRSDEQIKIRGYRVEPAEVEGVLSECPGVRACAVVARPDVGGENQLVAYVATQDGRVYGPGELRDFLRKSLPDYMVPSAYVSVDQLPLTPNGKIDRVELGRLETDQPCAGQEYVSPAGVVEQMIAQIWSDVLGVERIGAYDNFFDLGGHSLSATRLIARLRSAFNTDFPLRSIFQDPTIAGFASRIRYNVGTRTYSYTGQTPQWNCLVAAQPRGSRIPLFLVAGYQGPDDTLLVLSRIISHLGPNQPVYGFKPRWIEGNQQNYSSLDEAAREFLTELRMVQPKGPYMLGGHCVGGVVALEMARQLIEEGEEVGLLALIDTERPTSVRAFLANVRLAFRRGRHMASVITQIARAENGSRFKAVRELMHRKLGARKTPDGKTAAPDAFYKSKIGYRRQAYRHVVKPYPGKITLFVNEKQYQIDRNMGWKWFAAGRLTVKKVPGDHHTMLTEHGKEFGDILSACLSSAAPAPRSRNGNGAGA
jgi:amino acid adenylation domain-containing protein